MTKPSLNDPNDQLPQAFEDAAARIRNVNAPIDAVDRLIESASVELASSSLRAGNSDGMTSRRSLLRWAVAASIAAAVLVAVSFWPAGSNNLLASMKQVMSEVKTIKFVSRVLDPDQNVIRELNGFANEGNSIRQENSEMILIQDSINRKGLELHLENKTARVFPLFQQERSQEFFQAVFSLIRGEDVGLAKEVGTYEIEGIQVVEYEIKIDDAMARVFVEVESSLPSKIVFPMGDSGVRVEVSDFVFDEPLDDSMFAFNVPDDFEVQVIEDPGPIHDAELVMETGVGLGPVKFGFTTAEVIEQFGQPNTISWGKDIGPFENDVLFYKSRGFQFQVNPTNGVVVIAATDASLMGGNERFSGQYAGGIRIGDGLAKVVEALGEPTRKEGDSFIYDSPEAPVNSLSISFKHGKVSSMCVLQFP